MVVAFYVSHLLIQFYILKRNQEIQKPNVETHFQQITARSSNDGAIAEKLTGLLRIV